jgi:multiple sugar transport system substrate-binding protein
MHRPRPAGLLSAAALSLTIAIAGLACGGGAPAASTSTGPATGTIVVWVRAVNETFNKQLAAAYNQSHKAQVQIVAVPDSETLTKLSAAITSGDVPDIIMSDDVLMPKLNNIGVFQDITTRVNSLTFKDSLAQAYLKAATWKGKIYAVPHAVDASTLFYNKGLFKKAGLDPEKPPTTWAEIETDAKAITALSGGNYGFYIPGNCSGCLAYDGLPLIWASGGDVISSDGTKATFDSQPVRDFLTFYRQLWQDGVMPSGARTDNGANWLSGFMAGNIGMVGLGAFAIQPMKKDHPNLDFGVTYLPGKNGGTSSFSGGDVAGIVKNAKNPNGAWEFLSWELTQPVQLAQYAQQNQPPSRTDLTGGEYTNNDLRVQTEIKAQLIGRTPFSPKYIELVNDANGPWGNAIQKAVFSGKIDEAISDAQSAMTRILSTP